MSHSSQLSRSGEDEASSTEHCDVGLVLDVLDDAYSLSILQFLEEPATVAEIARGCDVPLSTAYRKVEKLNDAGLIEETVRLTPSRGHASQYERSVEELSIRLQPEVHCECSEE